MVAVLEHPPASKPQFQVCPPRSQPGLQVARPRQDLSSVLRRRRVVAFLILSAIVWLAVGTVTTLASWTVGVGEPAIADTGEPVVHIVESGDTVWSVARFYQPGGDVRPFVDRLLKLNGGSNIVVGQRLLIAP